MHLPCFGLIVREWHVFEEMHLYGTAISVQKQSVMEWFSVHEANMHRQSLCRSSQEWCTFERLAQYYYTISMLEGSRDWSIIRA